MALFVEVLGLVAGFFTTLSLFPEIARTAKMKETREISPGWLEMLGIGTFLWLVYGFLIGSVPLMAANAVSFLAVLVLAYLKLKYR